LPLVPRPPETALDTVLDDSTEPSPAPRRSGAAGWLLLVVLLLAAAAGGVWWWQQRTPADPGIDLSPEALDSRLLGVEQAVTTLNREQSGLEQKLTDTTARTGLLRDEVLGLGQRAAILEDNLHELSLQASEGRETLRLDEVELLLGLAQARLRIAGDTDGAIRATALARDAMTTLTAPQYISLRQTIGQELAALRELPADPRREAAGALDALQASLPTLVSRGPGEPLAAAAHGSGWQRLLDAIVQVRPSGAQDLVSPADRATGEAALGLELALVRTALDRGDESAFRNGLQRIDQWLTRLYAEDAQRTAIQARLAELGQLTLTPELPTLGAALQQLRALRGADPGLRSEP
jgi:uroporphyrin-3 C-methyltransferase